MKRRHQKPPLIVQPESRPPPKRRRIAHFQAGQESFTIRPGKQKQSSTDNNSSITPSRADAGPSPREHPQLHAPSPQVNPSQPLLDLPPASYLLQSPADALTDVSGLFVNNASFQIFILGHIELLTKATTRILKVLSGGCS